MKTAYTKLPTAAQLLLGLLFTVFGLNGFLHFLPQPEMTGPPAAFLGALVTSGYLFTLVKGVEVVAGLMLLARWQVPLALLLLAPVIVNILAFHAFLAPAGIGMALVVTTLELYVAWTRRATFAPLFRDEAPARAPSAQRRHESVAHAA